MKNLPIDIWIHIYEYDTTFHDIYDTMKKEFECDFLLESSSMYQKLVLDEQMINDGMGEYTPPR